MKKITMISAMLLMSLSFLAFTPAVDSEKSDYVDISLSTNKLEKEVSSFQEHETSVYTPSKAVYNKRVRYWEDFTKNGNELSANLAKVLARN